MIQSIRVFEGNSFDPYTNLATEKLLLDTVQTGECILYLWQNQNTVVIGKNQNAWAECRTLLLEQEGGKLARRLSGGGAVFHDVGNLNFTFLMCKEDYDLDRQVEVIRQACALAGIVAEKSGRNDLLAEGRKFSGNAFYQDRLHAYHHGTLMVAVDRDKLGRYLSPPKAKLEAKGVASVRSRVVNLTELAPELTIDAMKQYMKQAFAQVYGCPVSTVVLTRTQQQQISDLASAYSSWEYLYGSPLPFSFQCEGHFPWGHIQLQLDAKAGIVTDAKVYSDAMDWTMPEILEQVLVGCQFEAAALQQALAAALVAAEIRKDLHTLLEEQIL
ncbi:MAG: lipoate--protein ligase [Oscillospiraceae bacterium]|nr:lipoate--protein ligase [Oscillospiraceae bacterium]